MLNTPRRYLVTTAKWRCRLWTTLGPQLWGCGSRRGVVARRYVVGHQVPLVSERCTEGAPGRAVRSWPVRVEPRPGAAPDLAALAGPAPGFNAQSAQLTAPKTAEPWLTEGSHTAQQQALRDLDQGWRNFFAGTHRRRTWRKAGEHKGLQIVGAQALGVRRDNRARSRVMVPKVGWVQFKRSRAFAPTTLASRPLPAPLPTCERAWAPSTRAELFAYCDGRGTSLSPLAAAAAAELRATTTRSPAE